MNETINNLITRRSVRSFQKEQISEEQLNEILTAGTYAASGMGRQSAIMVVIQNPEIIKRLSKLNAAIMDSENDPFYGAPTVVVVLGCRFLNFFSSHFVSHLSFPPFSQPAFLRRIS